MSSCYQFCKVLLINFWHPKIFRKLYANMMKLFGRSSSRRRTSGASSSDSSARRSYVEPSESSTGDAATKTCLWPCDEYMMRVGIKEEFEQHVHNAGLTDFITDECDQHQILTNIFVQSFTFLPRNNPPGVSFDLYAENHQIPLTEFCNICMIPSDGSLAEPRPTEFEDFYHTFDSAR